MEEVDQVLKCLRSSNIIIYEAIKDSVTHVYLR